MDDRFLYFRYGSNMLSARLIARTPSALAHRTGYVMGRRLTFNKMSDDRSGKCDVELTGNVADHIEGVLFSIDRAHKKALDDAEALGRGYDEAIVDVITAQGTERAHTYVAAAGSTDAARRPYHWCKALVIAGAVQHGLSEAYIAALWTVPSMRDPMRNRRTKREAEAALEGTGEVLAWYRHEQGD
jgi:gamma-glutamylcyclotransferase